MMSTGHSDHLTNLEHFLIGSQ